MDILNKLDEINISVFDKLDISDRNKILFIENCYKGKLSYFLDIKKSIEALYSHACNTEYFGRGSEANPFRYENYDLTQYISKLNDAISALKVRFIELVVAHFEEKYKLSISSERINSMKKECKKGEKTPDAKLILELIFEFTQGRSFLDIGIQNIKSQLQEINRWRNSNITLKAANISISNMAYTSVAWNGDPEVNGDRLNIIILAVSVFEFGSPSNKTGLDLFPSWKVKYDPKSDFKFPMCQKVIGFRIYLNGRVDIKFSSKSDSAQFFDFFQLNIKS